MARIKVKEDEFSISQVAKKVRQEAPEPVQMSAPPQTTPRNRPKIVVTPVRLMVTGSIVIVLGVGAFAYSLYRQREDLRKEIAVLKTDPTVIARQQSEQLLSKVGRLVQLPARETPAIADVTDADKAKAQDPFYKDARNGDKVLFYEQAGQAILYRPSTDKIITTAPISQNKQP